MLVARGSGVDPGRAGGAGGAGGMGEAGGVRTITMGPPS
jgi:hypothetical protein